MSTIRYELPSGWIRYDFMAIANDLLEAKAAVMTLTSVPFQRSWAEKLQQIQLKQEVAGTSRIEGAEFTDRELDAAIEGEGAEEALTRSQRQARAATNTYKWLAQLTDDRSVSKDLILEIHRRVVTGCDDDHCEPGALRRDDHNVTFGTPRHRGVEGGKECESAFVGLCRAVETSFNEHDVLLRGLALHYHIGAMHPFGDGNGRTSRAVEALLLQRAGLRDALFISLSNFYYDEKATYLKVLAITRSSNHDLTEFFRFGLRGITSQCRRLFDQIKTEIKKALFRDVMHQLFNKLQSPKKRLIAKRQVALLNILIESDPMSYYAIMGQTKNLYTHLSDPSRAFMRDMMHLLGLKAIKVVARPPASKGFIFGIDLSWPEVIDESEFFRVAQSMPSAKTYKWMQRVDEPA